MTQMVPITNEGCGSGGEEDVSLAAAQELYRDAEQAFMALIRRAKANDLDAVKDVKPLISDLSVATRLLMTEKNRVAEQQRKQSGGVGGYVIDFDEARAQIGRRLDRLRAARDAGRVSE